MIVNFRVGNFKSFGEDQIFTAVPGKYRTKSEHLEKSKNYKLLKFSAIFGGNASGKSNFVDAIGAFRHMVVNGTVIKTFRDYSFRLEPDSRQTKFEIEMAIGEHVFAYGLAVDLKEARVEKEYLYETTNQKETLYFSLDRRQNESSVNHNQLTKSNKNRLQVYIQDLKKNELLIHKLADSVIDESDAFFTTSKNVYNWFKETLTVIRPNSRPINIIGQFVENHDQEDELYSVIDLIRDFDTGITDYKHETLDIESFLNKVRNEMTQANVDEYKAFEEHIRGIEKDRIIDASIGENYYRISYNEEDQQPKVELLTFEHCDNKDVRFAFHDESDGTTRLIELVNILYTSQFKNKVFVIDEIDRSLHPNLTIEFIKKFLEIIRDKASQMLITTHETNVMDLKLLRQDEIWIVERNSRGMSQLVSLNQFQVRSDKVLDKDYLRGRYGGIPNIVKMLKSKGVKYE